MDTIFNNAITSISIGVEDAQMNEKSRYLSAIRNIYSGILLLYKEKLRRLSPKDSEEVLIKSKIIPKFNNGELIFVGSGKKTIDVQEIKQRFKSIGIKTEWDKMDKIQEVRNNLEHYQFNDDPKVLVEILNYCFVIIRNFLVNELDEKPLHVFDREIWEALLENKEVFEREKQLSRESYKNSKLKSEIKNYLKDMSCYNCGSELVVISNDDSIFKGRRYL